MRILKYELDGVQESFKNNILIFNLLIYLVTCPNFESTFDEVDHIFILKTIQLNN